MLGGIRRGGDDERSLLKRAKRMGRDMAGSLGVLYRAIAG